MKMVTKMTTTTLVEGTAGSQPSRALSQAMMEKKTRMVPPTVAVVVAMTGLAEAEAPTALSVVVVVLRPQIPPAQMAEVPKLLSLIAQRTLQLHDDCCMTKPCGR